MISYYVRRDQLKDEDNGRYISFGIDIARDDVTLRVIKDVSSDEKELRKLVSLLNKLQPDLMHIDDIIEDFLLIWRT